MANSRTRIVAGLLSTPTIVYVDDVSRAMLLDAINEDASEREYLFGECMSLLTQGLSLYDAVRLFDLPNKRRDWRRMYALLANLVVAALGVALAI